MAYRLLWSGRVWSVDVPEEVGVDEALRWTYVQTFVATGGSHRNAMTRVLSMKYPGLAYGPVKLKPVSFVAASHGGVGDVCVSDMSVPVGFSNSRSQTPRPPPSGPGRPPSRTREDGWDQIPPLSQGGNTFLTGQEIIAITAIERQRSTIRFIFGSIGHGNSGIVGAWCGIGDRRHKIPADERTCFAKRSLKRVVFLANAGPGGIR